MIKINKLRLRNLDNSNICILYANNLGKGMNPTILSPVMHK